MFYIYWNVVAFFSDKPLPVPLGKSSLPQRHSVSLKRLCWSFLLTTKALDCSQRPLGLNHLCKPQEMTPASFQFSCLVYELIISDPSTIMCLYSYNLICTPRRDIGLVPPDCSQSGWDTTWHTAECWRGFMYVAILRDILILDMGEIQTSLLSSIRMN